MKLLIICCIFSLLICGCKKEQEPASNNNEKKTYAIAEINETGLEDLINNRMGKVLFINVWATWCVPCVEEFPDLVKVAEYYKDKDVDFISLNVDFSSKTDSLVIPFLKKFNADFPVYNIREKSAENVINILNPEWSGAIPATFIYDKQGRQMVFILGSEKYSNFVSAIDSVRSI